MPSDSEEEEDPSTASSNASPMHPTGIKNGMLWRGRSVSQARVGIILIRVVRVGEEKSGF